MIDRLEVIETLHFCASPEPRALIDFLNEGSLKRFSLITWREDNDSDASLREVFQGLARAFPNLEAMRLRGMPMSPRCL